MVCVYCGGQTNVTNSRLQKHQNSVWRRRRCKHCGAIFSSLERTNYDSLLVVRYGTSHIVPFQRDILFLSIYDACRHRTTSVADAAALSNTVIAKLIPLQTTKGMVDRTVIAAVTSETLRRFDAAAYTHYLAFHPLRR